jgi:hypothetical protein
MPGPIVTQAAIQEADPDVRSGMQEVAAMEAEVRGGRAIGGPNTPHGFTPSAPLSTHP